MYELGHVLLLFRGGQIGVVGGQGVEDSPAVAAQFLAVLRTIFPKLAVPLRKEADQGSVRLPGPEARRAPVFPRPSQRPTDSRRKPCGRRSRTRVAETLKAGPPLGARCRDSPPWLGRGHKSVRHRVRETARLGPPEVGADAREQGVGAGTRGGGGPGHLHLLLRPHPRLEVHAGPAGPPPGGVLSDLRIGGRRRGWRRGRGGGISPPRAPAARVRH